MRNVRTQYIKLILLTFDEKPIKEIEGIASSGSININGESAVRRTINLTMLASFDNNNILDLQNDFSLNKKIKIYTGFSYLGEDDIEWMLCGTYLITNASCSRGTNGWNISISGKDKMCLLDGTVGGVIAAPTVFHELYVYDNDNVIIEYPTLYQIIIEAVNHLGGEALENIIISDVPKTAKLLVRYIGEDPIHFNSDYNSFSYIYNNEYNQTITYGQDCGYRETDFTYPGELILNAGETIVALLDKIKEILGNFEYYYDVNGRFIFQERKNFLNTGSPLLDLKEENYVKTYSTIKPDYEFTSFEEINSLTLNPKYENIKNDFIVWGKNSSDIDIRYRLVIDKKPQLDLALQYLWRIEQDNNFLRYELTYNETPITENAILIGKPSQEWREELYRRALLANANGTFYSAYDMELLAEWRDLYDTLNEDWSFFNYWNPNVYNDPGLIKYWIDFIDTSSELGQYSISNIGRRTIVKSNNEVKTLYNKNVPDIIFLTEEEWSDQKKREYYDSIGQKYFKLTETYEKMFVASSTGVSAFDLIREMLYQNLNYNTQLTLQCVSRFDLEPNNIIYIEDKETKIVGYFEISQISSSFDYKGFSTITAIPVLRRL